MPVPNYRSFVACYTRNLDATANCNPAYLVSPNSSVISLMGLIIQILKLSQTSANQVVLSLARFYSSTVFCVLN